MILNTTCQCETQVYIENGIILMHSFLFSRSSTAPVDNFDGEEDDEHRFKLAEVSGGSSFQEEISQSQPVLSQGGSRNNPPPPALRRLRVILFEDVDTVFEEDAGFMGALGLLARTSKCPIIFSSNSKTQIIFLLISPLYCVSLFVASGLQSQII